MRIIMILVALAASSAVARAQPSPDVLGPAFELDHDPAGAAGGTTLTSGSGDGVRILAGQPQKEAMFRQMLPAYAKVERALGLQPGDAAGAVTLLVVQSYNLWHGENVQPSKKIVEQVRARLLANPSFTGATAGERRTMFEVAAILGSLLQMLGTQLEHDMRITTVKDIASAYLSKLQGRSGRKIHLDMTGITVETADEGKQRRRSNDWSPERIADLARITIRGGKGPTGWSFYTVYADGKATPTLLPLVDDAGIDAHRAKYATDLRTVPKGTSVFRRWPRGTTFSHEETHSGYAGGVSHWSSMKFTPDGHFTTVTGGAATISTPDWTVGAHPADRHKYGTYEVDGYRIVLHYADGTVDTWIIVMTDDKQMVHFEKPFRPVMDEH